jgi:hypothetical protein
VLVTHWWEFFHDQQPDTAFIQILHQVAEHLSDPSEFKVVTFEEVAAGKVPLN